MTVWLGLRVAQSGRNGLFEPRTPPTFTWQPFRTLKRLSREGLHDWARRDINSRWWGLRRLAALIAPWAGYVVVLSHGPGDRHERLMLVLVVPAANFLMTIAMTSRARTQTLRRYGAAEQPVDEVWRMTRVWWAAPVRTRATPLFAPIAVTLMVGAPFFGWALLDPDHGVTRLGYVGWLVDAVAAVGVALLAIAGAVLRRQVPARLATRSSGALPTRPARPTYVVGLVAIQVVVEAGLVELQRNEWAPGAICLLLIAAAVSVGPGLLWLSVIARRAERASGIAVTWLDCGRAVFGDQDVIAPELGQWVDMPRLVAPRSVTPLDSRR
jgi:hypothetical protein